MNALYINQGAISVGDKVKMIAKGGFCNQAYDGCIGFVKAFIERGGQEYEAKIDIKEAKEEWVRNRIENFSIHGFGGSWDIERIPTDWDE
jgi:hypothetical protein